MFRARALQFTNALIFLALLITPASTVGASPPGMPPAATFLSGCTGEYFNNTTLTGSATVVRTDSAINFSWPQNSSPAAGVNWDNYSVRWTCSVNFPASDNYTFTVTTDDGMNVLVDNNLVLWAFWDQGPTTYYPVAYVNAGVHTVKIEYYNRTLGGTARVAFAQGGVATSTTTTTTTANWYGEYFNNQSLSGSPVFTRNDSSINFDWGTGSPDGSVPVDHFSARWTATPYFNAGTWRFTAGADDGFRLWVDSNVLLDRWFNQSYAPYSADITLGAGNHTVRLEYYDNIVNAHVTLGFSQVSGTTSATPVSVPPPVYVPPPGATPVYSSSTTGVWHGQYFSNTSLSGSPVLTRDDATLNFNWGEGSPGPGVPVDFSAKWDSVQNFPATDNYTFSATSDDGIRVWIDGALVIDAWYDHGPTTFTATRYVTAGGHNVRVDYYDINLGAMISVQIHSGGAVVAPTPVSATPGVPASATTGVWHGQYYNNIWLTGSPVLTHDTTILNYNWGEGRPFASVPKDFSARWDSVQNAPYTGNYLVSAASDDGVRVHIDGALVIDGWFDHLPMNFTAVRYLTAGPHNVRVDFYDSNLGAFINVQIVGQ